MGQFDARPARRRRGAGVLALVVVVLVALVAGGLWWRSTTRARAVRDAAVSTVEQFVAGWQQRDLAGVPSSRESMAQSFTTIIEGLDATGVTVEAGEVAVDDTRATSPLDVTWDLPGGVRWSYTTRVVLLRLAGDEPAWQVDWHPSTVHPRLVTGTRLEAERQSADRGDILEPDGDALVTERPVVEVYVQRSRADDVDELSEQLADELDIDGDDLAQRVKDAGADTLVPVITLREDDYADVEDDIKPLPGTVFRRTEMPLAPTRDFARALLGSVGEVTAEQLEEQPERYGRGDVVGRSGLQAALDDRLRGTDGMTVAVVRADDGDDGRRDVVHEVAAEDGSDVTITLRRRIQRAADAALDDVDRPSALVAIDVPSGDVVAAANGPGAPFDIATTGQYAPGSTFKVVTTTRLLDDGLDPDDTVGCPGTITVDGREFGNAEDAQLGDVPFSTAFAQSCNTAFVDLSQQLEPGALQQTAQDLFGIGTRGDMGVGAFAGQVPEEESAVEVAAAAIGQGRVLVSPLIAADIAATVARGSWEEPRLLLEPSPGERGAGDDLPRRKVLRRLLRSVVTEGSGSALAGVPGPAVRGKTGTAEYGDADPPRTHAWFLGYQDDLAFAVLVAETRDSYGGEVAAPIAADFLTRLR